ncbi:MAG: acetyl-CoA carboxylase biotin carboxylase subunit [Alphaproteobacteria bacterium]
MFETLLIANRGEIACRVIRTARRLGVRTVAVYSAADAAALHVELADEAYAIGPAPAADSYLRADRILNAARRAGADAVHPGYGFLAENAAFAEACAAAGITFVGPPPAAIRAMGGKSEAKALMAAAGVPLVPGYHGGEQSPKALAARARRIGFPVLIKASAGGGGKGMRVVDRPAELAAALDGARREAAAAFGDDRVLLERYLDRARHVEIQVFGDGHGACVYLFERDCSIQRRHQKVVEEAPAPGLAPTVRRAMGEAAVAAARAIGYVGAGTVEFLLDTVDDGAPAFYFMEMNTRLQVEHPVTELITGLDLVELQLRVAAGAPLPFGQDDLAIDGHAIEVRLYAEDPGQEFLPATGTLRHFRLPATGPHVRVDGGVRQGDTISPHYDPMIAKLIVWDTDRAAARRRLTAALDATEIVGVATNVAFLRAVAGHPAFAAADLDTRFIERHLGDLLPAPAPASRRVLAMAALGVLVERRRAAAASAGRSGDRWSPWHAADGWRLNDEAHEVVTLGDGDTVVEVDVQYRRDGGYRLGLPRGAVIARGDLSDDGTLIADLDGERHAAGFVRHGLELTLILRGADAGTHRLALVDPIAAAAEEDTAGRLIAPMPGRVVAVLVEAGAAVDKGQPLIVLEAMKMEHTVTAPADGAITHLPFAAGDQVEEGRELIGFEPA